jgi:hypothetical protein
VLTAGEESKGSALASRLSGRRESGVNVLQLDETHSAPPNEHEQSYCVPTHAPAPQRQRLHTEGI